MCVTTIRPHCLGSRCTQPVLGGSELPYAFPLVATEVAELPMQKSHSDCSRVALVLESCGHVKPDAPVAAQPAQSSNSLSTRLITGICQT